MTARDLVRSSVLLGLLGCTMILYSFAATSCGSPRQSEVADVLSSVFFCLALSFSSIALGKIEEDKS